MIRSKHNMTVAFLLIFALLSFLWMTRASQPPLANMIPRLLNYQGYLAENGVPLNGTVAVTFALYDVPTGGEPLWTETQNVTVHDGAFSVLLGSVEAIPPTVFSSGETYLGMQVEDDPELAPRQRLVSVAYAFFANDANTLRGLAPSDFTPASHIQDEIHMVFIGSEEENKDASSPSMSITVPQEAKIAIINIEVEVPAEQKTAGQVILTKDGCTSATLYDYESFYYILTQASWAENTITITVKLRPSGENLAARATAYFYR